MQLGKLDSPSMVDLTVNKNEDSSFSPRSRNLHQIAKTRLLNKFHRQSLRKKHKPSLAHSQNQRLNQNQHEKTASPHSPFGSAKPTPRHE